MPLPFAEVAADSSREATRSQAEGSKTMAGKTIQEHLDGLKATRDALVKRNEEILQKSMDEDRSRNTAEVSETDDNDAKIKSLDADIQFASKQLSRAAEAATPAADQAKAHSDATARSGVEFATAKTAEKLEPGIAAASYAMCPVKAKGNPQVAFNLAQKYYPQTEAVVQTLKAVAEGADLPEMRKQVAMGVINKATVPAGTTTGATWAAPLVYQDTWSGDFVEYLRPRTLIGQSAFRPIQDNVREAAASTGGTAYWGGEGRGRRGAQFGFDDGPSAFTKVAARAAITQELARFSDPSAEAIVRDMLAAAVIAR